MIKTFELYLILLFSKKILNVFLIFFALVFILNLFEEINFFKDLQANTYFPIILSGLNTPATLFEIFPFIFLIGTQFFFLDIIDLTDPFFGLIMNSYFHRYLLQPKIDFYSYKITLKY